MAAAPKKPDRPEMPPQRPRDPPGHAGDIKKVCGNCQHFDGPQQAPGRNTYPCRNGISGRINTRTIDGCAFGFYPDIERFPLKAGPGGAR